MTSKIWPPLEGGEHGQATSAVSVRPGAERGGRTAYDQQPATSTTKTTTGPGRARAEDAVTP